MLVGPLQTYKTLAAGVAAAKAGDRVLLDPGTYTDDTAVVAKPLTIEGASTGAVLKITRAISNGKGILVGDASLTVRNLTFQGAQVTDMNGAGVRQEAGDLIVDNCTFLNNQDGILINPNPASLVTITKSTFTGNGAGDGRSHGIYANEVAQLTVADSTFAGTKAGHDIKSRALRTTVTNTVLDDGVSGTTSYAVDLSNGGIVVLDGLKITQGPNTQNPAMVAYGAEGNLKPANSLSVTNSIFTNQLSSPSAVGVYNFTSSVSATLTNNTVTGLATFLKGPGTVTAPVSGVAVRQGGVYSSSQTAVQSTFRLFNGGAYPGAVRITLADAATGALYGNWQSPNIPPNGGLQVPVSTIENAALSSSTKPASYVATIQGNLSGSVQHLVVRPATTSLSNITLCDSGVSTNGIKLANVHASTVTAMPSQVVMTNTGSGGSVSFGIFDAATGARLGGYMSPTIAAGGSLTVTVAAMEAAAHITPSAGAPQYTLVIENAFKGTLQHLIVNQATGALEDLTAVCILKAS